MSRTLKDTLKEIQILLGKPEKKIAGSLKYYLNLFNVSEEGIKEAAEVPGRSEMQIIQHKKITWVDIINPSRRVISELAQKYPFHPLHLEDCISKAQFPKIEQSDEDNYLFILLKFPHFDQELNKIVVNQPMFFLGKDYLVTIHDDPKDVISKIFNDSKEIKEERAAYMSNSSAYLLYILIEKLTDDLTPLLQAILKEVDETEDIVFDDKVSGVFKIGQLRQKIISLRRVLWPLKEMFLDMVTRINKFSKVRLTVYFEDISHRIDRTWEILEEARETVEVYKDADFIINTERSNRILAVLTIIFTLTIPATVIGTFYGMNIRLPGGLETGPWTFWGGYTTFIIILLISVTPTFFMFLYFKKRSWF